MIDEKQIEEMALILSEGGCGKECDCTERDKFNCHLLYSASVLYAADYRRQKVGEWTYSEDKKTMKCTICRKRMKTHDIRRYCPNCGARMKGKKEE